MMFYILYALTEFSSALSMISAETQTERRHLKSATFILGDSSDESDDSDTERNNATVKETELFSVETQTEDVENQFRHLIKNQPCRPSIECAAILKSEVSIF